MHICWCSYLDWNFIISNHQHKEVSSRSALTILFNFVFNTQPGLHCVSATHTHTHTHTHSFTYIYLSEYFHSSWAKVYILFVLLAEDLSSLWRLLWQPFTLPAFDMTLCSRSPTQHLPHLITFVYLVVLPLHQMELQEDWYFLVKFFIIYMFVPCWSKYSRLQFQTVWKIMNLGGGCEHYITI